MNNKLKVITRRAFGIRTYTAMEIALYHALGELPDPADELFHPQVLLKQELWIANGKTNCAALAVVQTGLCQCPARYRPRTTLGGLDSVNRLRLAAVRRSASE